MSVLALIPARAGSKGIPSKNFRKLGGEMLYMHAVACAERVTKQVYVSSDVPEIDFITRPPELAQDDTPMLAVVEHALSVIPGEPDQIVLLLQPTQPFRQPKHLQAAIRLLRDTQADSVVSVVELPKTHSPDLLCEIVDGALQPWPTRGDFESYWSDGHRVTRRQDATTAYRLDGTVYAFTREAFGRCMSIPCGHCRPLIIPAEESCELDTEQDWLEVERRWRGRHG